MDIVAHGQEIVVSVKLRRIPMGLAVLLLAVSCLFGDRGRTRKGRTRRQEKLGAARRQANDAVNTRLFNKPHTLRRFFIILLYIIITLKRGKC